MLDSERFHTRDQRGGTNSETMGAGEESRSISMALHSRIVHRLSSSWAGLGRPCLCSELGLGISLAFCSGLHIGCPMQVGRG
jgi:hypothetical protein